MKEETRTWSQGLQEQTRNAICEMWITHDGKLHFKHHDGRYAFLAMENLSSGKLLLVDTTTGQNLQFRDTDELLNTGWAID